MSRVYRHPCGCRSTDAAWVEMCAACRTEFQERHQRARAEHQNMGINDDQANVSPLASSPKVAPTSGDVTVPGASLSVHP